MDYIKLFSTEAEQNAFRQSSDYVEPHVSWCEDMEEVKYNKTAEEWANEYFTTIARENGTISFNIWKSMGTDMITSISYSTDNGEIWNTTNNTDNKSEHLVIDVNVGEGDKVLWKGSAQQLGYYDENDYNDVVGSFFSSTCEFDAQGNVMSLLYGDNYKNQMTIEETGAFCCLFYDYDGENTCEVVNTKNLSLPATTLATYCYCSMFQGCTNLTSAPELPATTLASSCYYYMFYGCTSLTTAPALPATTLADGCYWNMFRVCTNLTTAPELPATTLAEDCYNGMFSGCLSLVTAPELPATTLANYCYQYMFSNCPNLTTVPELPATQLTDSCYLYMFMDCTSLTTAPELPATTLADSCYTSMFKGCTNLVNAPELPATTLAGGCYDSMFQGCTSLTTAPELPATTLAGSCYRSMFHSCISLQKAPELPATKLTSGCYVVMFSNCTSLNYIKAMFTTTPNINYTNNWVNNVASSGTFVKNSAATWNVTGVNGVPTGWTVQTASE